MPRIDPLQLLNCLQVLLSPTTGGILSINEVQRLASLMTKFSKKLVSKCVYVLILKNTEQQLLGDFMAVGGWTLLQVWLHDAMCNSNWPLVKELLELVLITPVDVARLKSNNIPKLVKSLSKREELSGVHELSNKLVQKWLKIVKQETGLDTINQQAHQYQSIHSFFHQQQSGLDEDEQNNIDEINGKHPAFELVEVPVVQVDQTTDETAVSSSGISDVVLDANTVDTQTFYKLTVRDGKQVLSKVNRSEGNYTVVENAIIEEVDLEDSSKKNEEEKNKEKENREEKKERSDKSSKSLSKSGDKNSKDLHRSRDRDKQKSSSSRDKDRSHRDRKDRHNGDLKSKSSSRSSSSSKDKNRKESSVLKKDSKEKQAEKDKDTLAKVQPPSITKLPKIPKKSSDSNSSESKQKEPKKGSISIEVRKTEERPKTVKVFNAKMRSTGLEEEVKPPPPRPTKKPTTSLPTIPPSPSSVLKRTSPPKDVVHSTPPEKRSKIEPVERPGAIKLIPPKPKPVVLQESDMFMDALTASATPKKDQKKKRRRLSTSKESSSPPISPSITTAPTTPTETTQMGLKNITPPKFYQDTLEAESENEEKKEDEKDVDTNEDKNEEPLKEDTSENKPSTPTDPQQEMEVEEEINKNPSGLKGVLMHTKRKGPKKSIRWKSDDELVQIQYFELDETERVNVTKTFGDMAKMDLRCEREALQMCRKLQNEDLMEMQTQWRIPWEIELPDTVITPTLNSLEKKVQFAREKSVLQALYFNRAMIPDNPAEPDPENHQVTDPVIIPVEDPDNPDHDFRNTPWPEPKGSPPHQNLPNIPQVFSKVANNFQTFGVNQSHGIANLSQQQQSFGVPPGGFIPTNLPPPAGDWSNMNNHQMLVPNVPPPDILNPGSMNPNIGFVPPGPMPDNFAHPANPNVGFPPMFNQPRMFPPNHPNFRGHGDHHGPHRGAFRRGGGSGPWVRMNGPVPGNWNRGRGGHMPTRLCKNVRQHGYCRNRDNCAFFHPN